MTKFRTFKHLTREELQKAFTVCVTENSSDCIRFRSMVFGYIKKDDKFLNKHYSECWFCREFYELLCSIKPKQTQLNGDLKVD